MVRSRTIIVAGAAAFLLASAALAQTTSRTFHLTTVSTNAGWNEIATIIRVMDFGAPIVDATSRTITVRGTEDQLASAAWLVEQLDSERPQSATSQYTVAGSPQDAVHIFYLVNTPTMSGLNEMVTTLRVICDIQRIFTYSPSQAIVIRTTDAKLQLAEWLVQQVDVSPGSHPTVQRYPGAGPGGPDELVEVAFLTHERTQAGLNDAVTVLRVGAGIRSIFTHSSPQGIAFRGSAGQLQSAEHLLHQIDAQN